MEYKYRDIEWIITKKFLSTIYDDGGIKVINIKWNVNYKIHSISTKLHYPLHDKFKFKY